jgi:hypothetical protein
MVYNIFIIFKEYKMEATVMNIFGLILTSPLIIMACREIKRVFAQAIFTRTFHSDINGMSYNEKDVRANL